jgi:hypothetical protein
LSAVAARIATENSVDGKKLKAFHASAKAAKAAKQNSGFCDALGMPRVGLLPLDAIPIGTVKSVPLQFESLPVVGMDPGMYEIMVCSNGMSFFPG